MTEVALSYLTQTDALCTKALTKKNNETQTLFALFLNTRISEQIKDYTNSNDLSYITFYKEK